MKIKKKKKRFMDNRKKKNKSEPLIEGSSKPAANQPRRPGGFLNLPHVSSDIPCKFPENLLIMYIYNKHRTITQ